MGTYLTKKNIKENWKNNKKQELLYIIFRSFDWHWNNNLDEWRVKTTFEAVVNLISCLPFLFAFETISYYSILILLKIDKKEDSLHYNDSLSLNLKLASFLPPPCNLHGLKMAYGG